MKSRILVISYSRSGNTRSLARALVERIGCEWVEIKPKASYERPVSGYLRALRHSLQGMEPDLEPLKRRPESYDFVIVGGPVWAGKIASPVHSFLKAHRGKLNRIAFFATQGGASGRDRVIRQMESDAGVRARASLVISSRHLHGKSLKTAVHQFFEELKPALQESVKMKRPRDTLSESRV